MNEEHREGEHAREAEHVEVHQLLVADARDLGGEQRAQQVVTRLAPALRENLRATVLEGTSAQAALAREMARPGPCLIHASIDVEQHVYPMVPPGAANREMIDQSFEGGPDAAVNA